MLLSQGEFAKRHGVSPPAVTAWKKRGLLVFVDDPVRPGKKLVDATKSDLLVKGTIDPMRGRPRGEASAQGEVGAVPLGMASGSARDIAWLAESAERTVRRRIENEQLLGRLVSLDEYERRAGDMGRLVRERTYGVIRQLAERLAAESDPRAVATVLTEAFDGLFAQVADEIEAAASAESAADATLASIEAEADEPEDDAEV